MQHLVCDIVMQHLVGGILNATFGGWHCHERKKVMQHLVGGLVVNVSVVGGLVMNVWWVAVVLAPRRASNTTARPVSQKAAGQSAPPARLRSSPPKEPAAKAGAANARSKATAVVASKWDSPDSALFVRCGRFL